MSMYLSTKYITACNYLKLTSTLNVMTRVHWRRRGREPEGAKLKMELRGRDGEKTEVVQSNGSSMMNGIERQDELIKKV